MTILRMANDSAIFDRIRAGLASLPRTDNHHPDQPVSPEAVYTPPEHRSALDPDRILVVGNRGMGKSFWAHALLSSAIRNQAAKFYRQGALTTTQVVIGFNASERTGE